jgi:tetratricopeptide (TPR) repeat protein
MGNVIRFAEARARSGLERVKATYSAGEIARQFGLSTRHIRRWTQEGLIHTVPGTPEDQVAYDYRALTQFRRVRELRNRGLSIKQIEAELRGQLNLFPAPEGELIRLPRKLTSFEEALLLHERADPKASELYLKAIGEEDCVADAFCNLGILEFESGNVSGSFDRFTSALAHDPRHFESHFNLAYLYFEAGDLRLAQLHYEMAARIEPNHPDVYFNLGLVHAAGNHLNAALDALRKARELAPEEEREKVEALLSSVEKAVQSGLTTTN